MIMPPIKTIRIRNHYFGLLLFIHTLSHIYKSCHINMTTKHKKGEQEKLLLTLLGSYYTNTYKL